MTTRADIQRCEHATAVTGSTAYLMLERKTPAVALCVRLCPACAQRVATMLDEQGYLPVEHEACE